VLTIKMKDIVQKYDKKYVKYYNKAGNITREEAY
jgi:predicted nucleic acid-binding OB-fold protein